MYIFGIICDTAGSRFDKPFLEIFLLHNLFKKKNNNNIFHKISFKILFKILFF
jgi:hypothetical protein